jgi:hypothetical protein
MFIAINDAARLPSRIDRPVKLDQKEAATQGANCMRADPPRVTHQ